MKTLSRPLLGAFLLLAFSAALFGQATEGSILGLVTDESGAVIPGATVQVTSVETGARRVVSTSESGEFVVTNLSLGSYIVRVEAKGFKAVAHPPVTISVKARIRVDSRLQLGDISQTVEVSGQAPLIKTDTPEVGGVITQRTLQDVPVFGRNFLALAALVPGTTSGASVSRQRDFSGAAVTVAGASAEANNFIIDGISNNMEFSGATAVMPAMDAIQEFAIQTSQYSAEFGRSGGGVVNVAIKSGTNQLHGFAYDYLRNDKLDARPYDFTHTGLAKSTVRRNQFGAGAGAPVIRNRSFVFGNYEGTRFPSNAWARATVPTVAEKQGDFSGSGFNIYDPTTAHTDPASPSTTIRDPFPNNQIPASRFSPITRKLLGLYPDPNFTDPNPSVRDNYLTNQRNSDNLNSFTVKSDNNLTSRDSLMGRISQQRGGRYRSSWMPNDWLAGNGSLDATNTGLTYTRVLLPTVVNEVRIGYNYLRFGNEMVNHTDVLGEFKIPGYNIQDYIAGINALSLRNYSSTSMVRPIASVPNPFILVEHTWQYMDNVSIQHGAHALKFGGEYSRVANNRFQGRQGGGAMSFDGTYTTRAVGQSLETLRNGVPDALLGAARSFTTQYAFDAVRIHSVRASGFAQDDWRVRPNLSLSFGLRYDFFGPFSEEQDRFNNFDMSTGERVLPESTRGIIQGLGIPGGNLPAGWRYGKLSEVMPQKNWRNFAPRFGFAWSLDPRLVLRGGYGIFYGVTVSNNANNSGTEGSPFFFDFALASELTRSISLTDGFPTGGILPILSARTFSAYYSPIDRRDPYTQKYSLNLQVNLFSGAALELGYTGQRALAFPTLVPGNTPRPGPGTVQDRRPYPNVGSFYYYLPVSDSNYNGFETTFRLQRFHGLTVQSAFTFSKSMGYSQGTDGQSATDHINDPYNYRYDYGPLNYDFRKRWVTAFTYDIPAPRRLGRVGAYAFGNWQISSLTTLQGGFPFSVYVSGQVMNNGAGTNRANMARNGNLPVGERTVDRWFDTTAFTMPASYEWGAQGKNSLRGPGLANVDFALQKAFPVSEGKRFILRMESTNFFNRVQYGNPSATLGGTNFGVIRSLQSGARNIQLVGRFLF